MFKDSYGQKLVAILVLFSVQGNGLYAAFNKLISNLLACAMGLLTGIKKCIHFSVCQVGKAPFIIGVFAQSFSFFF